MVTERPTVSQGQQCPTREDTIDWFLPNDQDYSTECGEEEWQLGTHVRRVGCQNDESDQRRAAHGGEHTADGQSDGTGRGVYAQLSVAGRCWRDGGGVGWAGIQVCQGSTRLRSQLLLLRPRLMNKVLVERGHEFYSKHILPIADASYMNSTLSTYCRLPMHPT